MLLLLFLAQLNRISNLTICWGEITTNIAAQKQGEFTITKAISHDTLCLLACLRTRLDLIIVPMNNSTTNTQMGIGFYNSSATAKNSVSVWALSIGT